MEVKKYVAASMPDALAKVRAELGPLATVLSMRQLPGSRWAGRLIGTPEVEVVATSELTVDSRLPNRVRPAKLGFSDAGIDLTQLDKSSLQQEAMQRRRNLPRR